MEEMHTVSYCNTIYSTSIHGEWTDFSSPTGMLAGDHIPTAGYVTLSHWFLPRALPGWARTPDPEMAVDVLPPAEEGVFTL